MIDSNAIEDFVRKGAEDLAKKWEEYYYSGVVSPPLALSTIVSKIRKGSKFPTTPLVDTELAIQGIEARAERMGNNEIRGTVGIFDPLRADIMLFHEFGMGNPERPTLRPVFDENIDRIIDNIFDEVFNLIENEFYRR